jgi:hypothetical protein
MDPAKLMKKGWSSSLASAPAYQYQALHQDSKMFRLLDLSPSRDPKEPLRGTIRTVNVDFMEHAQSGPDWKGPRWTALSYVWTDPDDPNPVTLDGQTLLDPKRSEEILIGNTSLMITPNLFQALMLIRGYEDFCTIWADQICIYPDRYRTKCCRNLRSEPQFCERVGFAHLAENLRTIPPSRRLARSSYMTTYPCFKTARISLPPASPIGGAAQRRKVI